MLCTQRDGFLASFRVINGPVRFGENISAIEQKGHHLCTSWGSPLHFAGRLGPKGALGV